MNETTITITGNVVSDPDLSYTPTGVPVTRFRVASTPRYLDKASNTWKDGDSLFMGVQVWRQQAENAADSLTRGTRVVVTGKLRQRSYEDREGAKRTVYEIDADDVSVSLQFAAVTIRKAERAAQQAPASAEVPF
jgi:single-strand DNA-binding protein